MYSVFTTRSTAKFGLTLNIVREEGLPIACRGKQTSKKHLSTRTAEWSLNWNNIINGALHHLSFCPVEFDLRYESYDNYLKSFNLLVITINERDIIITLTARNLIYYWKCQTTLRPNGWHRKYCGKQKADSDKIPWTQSSQQSRPLR